ncbi:MAG TPA: 3-ketoacyl-ACP reductase [Acetobacteraceae bacterium]|nr:3-ketoacyl-ACP reductase [Acetobacteraceae bacterium]
MGDRKVALITGSRRGIGCAAALALADAGFDIVLNDVVDDADAEKTLRTVTARGANARFIVADISDLGRHEDLLNQLYATFGRLDCLVNNAGVQLRDRVDVLDADVGEFDRLIGVNLRGTFFLTQAAARRMIAESATRPGRSIVTITSANAVMVSPEKAAYCISKAGLSMAAQLFAVRLAQYGIPVFEIRPGLIETDMTLPVRQKYGAMIEKGLMPIPRWGTPEEVGQAVANLAVGTLPYSIGQPINIDGGLLAFRL